MSRSVLICALFLPFVFNIVAGAGVKCFGGKCFKHFNVGLGWSQAVQFCKNVSQPNAQISIIRNAFEDNAIKGSMGDFADYDWIGLHYVGQFIQEWLWVDGTSLNYTNWAPNEPKVGKCAQICHFDFSDGTCVQGKWITRDCADVTNVSCKIVVIRE